MEQLSGLDSAFVHQDSRRTPMHMCAVMVYDASNPSDLSLDQLKRVVEHRLGHHPVMRRKLQKVMLGFDNPYWVDLATVDWDYHIRAIAVPAPGDYKSFQALLADLHSQRLDQHRPLWSITLVKDVRGIPGLPERCLAFVLKIHHAAIDGVAMAEIINALHQDSGTPASPRSRRGGALNQMEIWTRAQSNSLDRQMKFAGTVRKLVPGILKARRTQKDFADLPPTYQGKSLFNTRVRSGRSVGFLVLPRNELVGIKRAVRGVTLNDVAMSCIAGALRGYLKGHRALPSVSLMSGVPVSLRQQDKNQKQGNVIATMAVGLATDMKDPVARLKAIHRYAVAGKKKLAALGSTTAMEVSDSLAPAILAEGIRSLAWASELTDRLVPFHTMISNVPGPSEPTRLLGAKLVAQIGFGPVRDNMGLFHVISNTDNQISISFSASRDLITDPDVYARYLRESYESLLERSKGIER